MESISLMCSTCQIYLKGIDNYTSHVNSLEHANQIRLKSLENVTDEDKVYSSSNTDSLIQVTSCSTKVDEPVNMSATKMNSSLLSCELCQKYFTGNEPYRQHIESAGHKKKLATSSDSYHGNISGIVRCDICDKNFSGPIPYDQHMSSSMHKKKVAEKEMNRIENPIAAFVEQCKTNSKSDIVSQNIQDAGLVKSPSQAIAMQDSSIRNPIAFLKCDTCDKSFSGPVPYEQHMSSNVHLKRLKEKEILHTMQSKTCNTESMEVDAGNNMSANENLLHCRVCNKTFSGAIPLQQHLSGVPHQKKIQSQELLLKGLITAPSNDQVDSTTDYRNQSELPNNYVNGTKQTSESSDNLNELLAINQIGSLLFKCEVCDKSFNGRIPYDQHMISPNHKKKMQQKTPLSNGENKDMIDGFSVNASPKTEMANSLYFCKMCDKQCSGSVPYVQHQMSEAHCKKMRLATIEDKLKETRCLDSTKPKLINEHPSVNYSEDECLSSLENGTERMSPRICQNKPDLILGDVLKDLNVITPDTLNITTFNVNEKIVFDSALR